MTKPRKLWATQPPLMKIARENHRSQAAAYRCVANWAEEFRADVLNPRIRQIEVYVDERDGHGWKLYERIELADYGKEE